MIRASRGQSSQAWGCWNDNGSQAVLGRLSVSSRLVIAFGGDAVGPADAKGLAKGESVSVAVHGRRIAAWISRLVCLA